MSSQSGDVLLLQNVERDRRVAVKPQLIVVPRVKSSDRPSLFFGSFETHYECLHKRIRNLVEHPVELGRGLTKAGKDVFGQPDVPFLSLVASDVVALLTNSRSPRSQNPSRP